MPCGATLGYGVAILSYNSTLCFGMSADPNLMPDVSLMKFFVDEVFAELKDRAADRARGKGSRDGGRNFSRGGRRMSSPDRAPKTEAESGATLTMLVGARRPRAPLS